MWMNSDTASVFARDEVLSAEEARGYLNQAIAINASNCSTLFKPALYLLDAGYDRIFTRPFYYKQSLDTCFIALLVVPCPEQELSQDNANQYYRFVLNSCKPRPYQL
jgi:hypothetical protein